MLLNTEASSNRSNRSTPRIKSRGPFKSLKANTNFVQRDVIEAALSTENTFFWNESFDEATT